MDKDHREYFADLSASVASRGGPVRVYVLFEHKSWSDAGTLLQLLRYMVQVWARELKAGGGGGTGVHGKSLTPVIPVVVYHGEGAAPRMSFQDLLLFRRTNSQFRCRGTFQHSKQRWST